MKKEFNKLPILIVENNMIISEKGQISFAYKMILPEIFTSSELEYSTINNLWEKIIYLLGENTFIHEQSYYLTSDYKPTQEPKNNLDLAYEQLHNEKKYLEHDAYIFFSKIGSKGKGNVIPENLLIEREIIDFIQKIKSIEQIINESKLISIKKLTEDEILNEDGLFNKYLNCQKETKVINSITEDSQYSHLKIGDKYHFSYLVEPNGMPNSLTEIFTHPALSTEKSIIPLSYTYPFGLGLKQNHVVNKIIYSPSKEGLELKLMFKSNQLESLQFIGENKNNFDDHTSYKKEIQKGIKPLQVGICVGVWTNKIDEIETLKSETITAFSNAGITPTFISNDQLPIFMSCFPGNCGQYNISRDGFYALSNQAKTLLTSETNSKDSVSDFGVKLNDRTSGIPLHVDISDIPMEKSIVSNRNKLIFGPSGSGKSFFTNHLTRAYLKNNAHVLIIDVGDSYKRTCMYEGGVYFTYEDDKPISFNPFYLDGHQLTEDKSESLVTLIFTLWKKNVDNHTKEERTILSNSIQEYYVYLSKNKDVFPSFNTFFDFVNKEYAKVIEQKNRTHQFDLSSFNTCLEPFTGDNQYGYLLNSKENLNLLHEKFIVFELEKIKDNPVLFPIVTLIIMDTFIQKLLTQKGVRKVILIEEAWKAMSSDIMAEFMKYLFKTCRKYFGEALLVTQEVEDILENEIVKNAIIKNAGCKILLDMKDYLKDFDRIKNYLNITDHAANSILSINQNLRPNVKYKEVGIILGNLARVYGLEVSKKEYLLYTTEETESLEVYQAIEKYKDIDFALNQLISLKQTA